MSIQSAAKEDQDGEEERVVMIQVAVGTENPCKLEAVQSALQKALSRSSKHVDQKLEVQVEGFSVESGVPDQPFGDVQTQQGAKNRARNAYKAYRKTHGNSPHLAVGLEGGLEWLSEVGETVDENGDGSSDHPSEPDDEEEEEEDDEADSKTSLWCMAWMAIYGKRTPLLSDSFASLSSPFYSGNTKPIFGLSKTAMFLLPESISVLVRGGMELGDADDQVFGRVNSKQGSGTVGVLTDSLIDRAEYYEHAMLLALVPWIRPDVYFLAAPNESVTSGSGILNRLMCKFGSSGSKQKK